MNEEKCADACWVRHLAHLGGEEGGAEPRLAGAQHCAAAGVCSLKYRGLCKCLLCFICGFTFQRSQFSIILKIDVQYLVFGYKMNN